MKNKLRALLAKLGRYTVAPNSYHPSINDDPRSSPATKVALTQLYISLRAAAKSNQLVPDIRASGFRIYSQFEEDGYLLYLAAVLEIEEKSFVDIGSGNGINSNCANLSINLGWNGLFIDGNEELIKEGTHFYASHPDTILYPPSFVCSFITAENINDLIAKAGFFGKVGIVSIDLDGNDCWIWKSLNAVNPAIVVIETHIEFGMHNIAVPYDPNYFYPGKHPDYHGASAVAMVSLAKKKGYRLVGANRYGFNLVFVRCDLFPERVPEVSVESILSHPRYRKRLCLFDPIKDWDYVAL